MAAAAPIYKEQGTWLCADTHTTQPGRRSAAQRSVAGAPFAASLAPTIIFLLSPPKVLATTERNSNARHGMWPARRRLAAIAQDAMPTHADKAAPTRLQSSRKARRS